MRTVADPVFASLDPISLDELTARAALLTRRDRKYVLPVEDLDGLLARLEPGTRALEIDGRRRFGYESVYFDTGDLVCYRGAAYGRRRRFKVRTRTYLDTDGCFVEVKTRGPRGATVKTREPYRCDERDTLTLAAWAFAHDALCTAGVAAPRAGALAATLVSRYERSTLFLPCAGARATVDTGLTWCSADGDDERALPGLAVVETKAGATPSSLDRALWRAGHRPVRLSKYGTGMAVLHPDLPATRWRRTLDRLPVAG
jgi:hypothetical protein